MNLKPYFHRKKIVHSTEWQPGEMVKVFTHRGKKYVRIAFTNKIHQNRMPITDVLFQNVVGIRRLPSRFEKWFWNLFGIRARGKYYVIKKTKAI
jgi:anaerobic selenocysteine-containing dehydrogenase